MFQRLLVPLDGLPGAERAIPVAARLARSAGGSLVLFHVVPLEAAFGSAVPKTSPSPGDVAQETQALTDASIYLAEVMAAHSEELTSIPTEMDVAFGLTSPLLASTTRREHVDLVVMCSHREAGLGPWGLASFAQQAMRRSPVPLLILHEYGPLLPLPDASHPLRVIVPLDGSLFAEAALEPAVQFVSQYANSTQDELCLLRVVDEQRADHTHGYTQAKQEAERYLQAICTRLNRRECGTGHNIRLISVVSGGEDVAAAIGEQAQKAGVFPLISMATHGREGVQRLLLGSVAERVLGATTCPLLVVCPPSAADQTAMPGQHTAGKR